MIGIVFAMIRARRAQAVTLFLLAAIAVAAAVAGPVSTRATDAAIVRLEVANASDRERSIAVVSFGDPSQPAAANRLNEVAEMLRLPGFEVVRSGEIQTVGPVADPASLLSVSPNRLVFREDLCAHVTMVSGRCLASPMEILIGEQTAERRELAAGTAVTVMAARYDEDGTLQPDGPPARVTVAGVYRPTDYEDPYWAGQTYFRLGVDGSRGEVVFTNVTTIGLVGHTSGSSYADILAPAAVLTGERLAGIEEELDQAVRALQAVPEVTAVSQLPELAQRVETSRALAGQLGPVAFIPLAGISLFVIYLAVAYGVFGRRGEIGLVALRGLSVPRRWWLAGGETLVPILAGAPVGYVLGHIGVGLVAKARLGSADGAELSAQSLPYAGVALALALGLALLGQWRSLREPVVELLRGVPRARAAWRSIAVEALVVALAVVATLQLRTDPDGITGLGLLVPALLVVMVALLAARANVALTGLVGKFALRRGLLGVGLSAVQLARRQGSQRLFVLLAVGTAMLAFVAAGTDVASRAREDRAIVATGASRVLEVAGASARDLLSATHEADPEGAWAMAAVIVPPQAGGGFPVLAVDSSRLATVAAWRPEFGADPAAVARAIAAPETSDPGYRAPVIFQGTELAVELQVIRDSFGGSRFSPLDVELEFVRLTNNAIQRVPLRGLEVGSHTLTVTTAGCEQGCRFTGLAITNAQVGVRLVLRGIRAPHELLTPELLADRNQWRSSSNALVSPAVGGVAIRTQPRGFSTPVIRVAVVGAPTPVPLAVPAVIRLSPLVLINSLDFRAVEATQALSLSMLPRLGQQGVLADMRYLELTLLDSPGRDTAEIWLGPLAPADAAQRFRDLGLQVTGESTTDAARAAFARHGPALALQFHLTAAAFGVLLALGGLGLVAAVDRRARAADLRALRVQGLRRRMARRAALWGYLSVVLLAALTGLLGAALAWAAAGDRIPIFTDTTSPLQPPRWPDWLAVVQPWAVTTGAMAVAAMLAAWALRAAVARGNGGAR